MKTLGPLLIGFLAISGSFAVDRNNFKTCEQSGFCKRLRAFKPEKSHYVVDFDNIMIHDNLLFADVNSIDLESESKTVLFRYVLKISALVDSTFRVEMEEVNPLYPRFSTMLALKDTPLADKLDQVSKNDGQLVVANSKGHKVVITASPLKIEFLDKEGEVAVVLNENSQLLVEPLIEKKQKNEENGEVVQVQEEEGMWGENFKSHHDSKPRGNEAISLDFSFPDADQVYGIPEHTDGLALSTTTGGEPYRLYNLDVFEYELNSRMAIYGSVPVLYAHGTKRTVGVFWHNSAETWVDIVNYADETVVSSLVNLVTGGHKRRVSSRFMSESGLIDTFIMMGDKPADVFRQYTRLTGAAPLPPKFSLAYHQCRWNYVDEADVRGVDENFDVHDIPADVIWLDIEYTDRKKYFTWDAQKFPHPAEMVANLTAKGRRLVAIIDPHIKREAGYFLHEDATSQGLYVKDKDGKDYEDWEGTCGKGRLVAIIDPHIKREAGYFLHEDATSQGLYVKDKDGKDYEGWCWPGSSSYLDFLNPEVSKYYSERFRFENFPGTSKDVHIWNDMNEPSVFNGPEITMPKDCRHYREHDEDAQGLHTFWEHRHIHNEYGLFHIRATHQGMLDRSDGKYRPFILTRAVFAGTQRYAAVWTGDNAAEWGFLVASVPMCLSLGVAGVSFCGSDVGGFFQYPEAELMTRWYQAGAYQPFFRAHSHIETKRREPWLYEPATTALLRDATRRRYALLDFWYTLFYEHTRDGLPVMRPIFQEYPQEEATFTIDDTYLLGNKLLVRPVTAAGATTVQVYLPGAESHTIWYDVDSYQAHKANGYFTQEVNIAKIPVYQRGGSIVPRKERVRRSSALMANDPYTLVIALDANNTAEGTLYIDDGETFEYKKQKYIYAKITYTKDAITYSMINEKAVYPTKSWVERIVICGARSPPASARLHQAGASVALPMTLHKGNDVLVIRKPGAAMAQPWTIRFSY